VAHTAFPDLGGDFIRAEAGAWSEGQAMWIIGSRRERGGDSFSSTLKWRGEPLAGSLTTRPCPWS
jgi:hypothetical protein